MGRLLGIVQLSAIGLLLMACSSGTNDTSTVEPVGSVTVDVPSDWINYSDEISGFSLSYPNEWVVFTLDETVVDALLAQIEDGISEDGTMQLLFQAGLPQPDGRFSPSVTVVIESLPGDTDVNEFAAMGIDGFKAVVPSYEVTEQVRTVVGGRESVLTHGSYDVSVLHPSLTGRYWMVELAMTDGRIGWNVGCGQGVADSSATEPDLEECETVVRTFEIADR